jgi:lipopolysaccharide biosynthesis glycosyltransferase
MTQPLPPVVCCIDDAYVRPLSVLLESMARADGNSGLRLLVMHENLTGGGQDLLQRHADRLGIEVVLHRARPVTGPVSGWVSEAVYLRLAIGETLGPVGTILYLDADTLVMGNLRPLLRTPLGGPPLGAVRDPRSPVIGAGRALPAWASLGLSPGRDYFNSGVMLLDLPECERQGLFLRAWRFLAEHPDKAMLWDQDALNVAADDQWLRLHRKWNTFALSPLAAQPGYRHDDAEPYSPLAMLLADEPGASILHFAGPTKPWQDDYPAGRLRTTYRRFLYAVLKAESDGRW